jgi:hypothetical protein
MIYNLTIQSFHQSSLASYSNKTKVYNAIQYLLKDFTSVEFVGIFDMNKKKVNHKNLSLAMTLLNVNESFSLKFTNDVTSKTIIIDLTKTVINPANEMLFLPSIKNS